MSAGLYVLSYLPIFLLFQFAGLIGMGYTRYAIGRYRYGCGGKLRNKRSPDSDAPEYWWYSLRKPSAQPPNAVFGVAWIALYTLVSYALWRALLVNDTNNSLWLVLVVSSYINLGLNAAWTPVFYGHRNIGGALACIVGTLLTAALNAALYGYLASTLVLTWTPFWVHLPYVLWLVFATYLNGSIYSLNKSDVERD